MTRSLSFAVCSLLSLVACGEMGATKVATGAERPGLGTEWGEQVRAPVSFTPFERASSSPFAELALHYNDAAGVAAHAAYLGAPTPYQGSAGDGALVVTIVDDHGRPLPGIAAGERTLIVGQQDERYSIVVHNTTPARFEVVASVDGLDVMDGQPADPNRRGYIIDPRDTLVIDGFRTSEREVAAFRFGRVADSYAARTTGDRDVGVIGMAFFTERGAAARSIERYPVRGDDGDIEERDSADPFPARGFATPPR